VKPDPAISGRISIAGHEVGAGRPSFIIAEVAQAHEGSLGMAHAYIDAAAESGADAIKFQTHIADAESTRDEKFRVPMSGQDASRFDYWKRMEFTPEQWAGLFKHAAEKNIVFLSSAFSVPAVELLASLGMSAWKVGSGEFRSQDLLEAMRKAGGPVLLSTGMSRTEEVAEAVAYFTKNSMEYALFQCTSMYPTPLEKAGVNVIGQYRAAYNCPVGLSDHTGTVYPSLMAMAQGADLIEVHVTFDRRMYGPDAKASLTFAEIAHLAQARDAFHTMAMNPVDKDKQADEMDTMRQLFTKSIALKSPAAKGAVISADMIVPKKPGTGIPYTEREKIIGKVLARDVPQDRLLAWEDVGVSKGA
jgi:N-acetylneuraminate synthase